MLLKIFKSQSIPHVNVSYVHGEISETMELPVKL